jgi:hypothetical protein
MEWSVPLARRGIHSVIAAVTLAATALQASIMSPVVPMPFAQAKVTTAHQAASADAASDKSTLVRGEVFVEPRTTRLAVITGDTAKWRQDIRILSYQDSANILTFFFDNTPAMPLDSGLTVPVNLQTSVSGRGVVDQLTLFTDRWDY